MQAHPSLFRCDRSRYEYRKCLTFKEAWELFLVNEPTQLQELLVMLESPMPLAFIGKLMKDVYKTPDNKAKAEVIKQAIDFDRDIAFLLEKYARPMKSDKAEQAAQDEEEEPVEVN